jgi:hypothetical protein
LGERIVLFGAAGYTGELTARAMVERGLRPVLAGRRREALQALAEELGGLDFALADADNPETVRALVARGDVLVTTVGPMALFGESALWAAIDAGAHYIDSTGEPAFVRKVFEEADAPARAAGSLLLPAMAYDSVPGNLAGSLALRHADEAATRVRIGYFLTGARRGGLLGGFSYMSGGSRTTFTAMGLEEGFAWRGGRLLPERGAARVGVFEIGGRRRRGVSFGTTEAYSLPRVHAGLSDVEVYFGWFENASRMIQLGALAMSGLCRVPGARPALRGAAMRLAEQSTKPPRDVATGSLFVAEAVGRTGAQLSHVRLEGINGYVFSGRMLAWAAEQVASRQATGVGALGPVEAFDLPDLETGVAECGIERKEVSPVR